MSAKQTKTKPVVKKTTTKRTAAKKPVAKKTTAKRTTAKTQVLAALPKLKPTPKRPATNPGMPQTVIDSLANSLNEIKIELENYAAHLRSLDRKRLNGVGIKKLGFIERALELAEESPEFLPNYLTLEKFQQDYQYFLSFQMLTDLDKQIQELMWNITIQSADMVYTDALEYYASVHEAAKRRIDASETVYKDLEIFFKKMGRKPQGEPTEKEIKRDMNALLRGKRDGKIVIENINPKVSGGKHKVIDEKFTDTAQFKETAEGEIQE